MSGEARAPSVLADGLARRLDELQAALRRVSSFAFEPGRQTASLPVDAGDAQASARELVQRMLRTAGDPTSYRILERLAAGHATLEELAGLVALPRLAAWERMNDLVQAGLAAHSIEAGGAEATPAGQALVEWVEELSLATAERSRR